MKILLLSLTCAALAATASAQVFQPATASNMLLGGIAGAVIGEHNHHQALAGAAIGAAAGYVWSAATEPRAVYCAPAVAAAPVYYAQPTGYAVDECAPTTVVVGNPGYYRVAGYYGRPTYYAPREGYYCGRPGAVWGREYGHAGYPVYHRPAPHGVYRR